MSQFSLLRERRFAPFFWTQAAGAANDNLLKFAVTMLVTYQLQVSWLPPAFAGLAIGALFVLPYLLFSATSGQLADKYDKREVIRLLKTVEIGIALMAAVGLVLQLPSLMLVSIFLMGLQSTVLGPVKYSYLPQHLGTRELTGGNGMVEMGTFVSILLGNLAGGALVSLEPGALVNGAQATALACVVLAVLGRWAAQGIPVSPASDPALRINWNPITETWRNLKMVYPLTAVFRSLLGISWMWLFGSVFLAQFPTVAKDVLQGNEHVASLLLVVFSLGIATGSLMCESLSQKQVEIGLVPIGALGMTIFSLDLYFATRGLGLVASPAMGLSAFLSLGSSWRVLADLFGLSLAAGLFSVPLYALMQMRSPETHRSRVIAANNVLNALFMVMGALLSGAALALGATVQELFFGVAVLNTVVAIYIFTLVPEYVVRFAAFVVTRCLYRFRTVDAENIPTEGAAILAPNHVSFADAFLVLAVSPRPVRFVMDYRIFKTPVLGLVFRLAKAIPIAPKSEDPVAYEKAFDAIDTALAAGELVCIFPEGGITHDGTLQPFKGGIAKVLARRPVPVVPLGLVGLWGGFFSRAHGSAMSRPFVRGLRSSVEVRAGVPMRAEAATPDALRDQVAALCG